MKHSAWLLMVTMLVLVVGCGGPGVSESAPPSPPTDKLTPAEEAYEKALSTKPGG